MARVRLLSYDGKIMFEKDGVFVPDGPGWMTADFHVPGDYLSSPDEVTHWQLDDGPPRPLDSGRIKPVPGGDIKLRVACWATPEEIEAATWKLPRMTPEPLVPVITAAVKHWQDLRGREQWDQADALRSSLERIGVICEAGDPTRWRRA